MDGFVLPPFESTSILKDNDIIWFVSPVHFLSIFHLCEENILFFYSFLGNSVRKKVGPPSATIELYNGVNSLEQPALGGVKLLTIEAFQNVTGGYRSQSEEGEHDNSLDVIELEGAPDVDKVCKKRKASEKLQGSEYVSILCCVFDIGWPLDG